MAVSKKRTRSKKRKNVLNSFLRHAQEVESASIIISLERDNTCTVTDERTGEVVLSGLDADATGMTLAKHIVDYLTANGLACTSIDSNFGKTAFHFKK